MFRCSMWVRCNFQNELIFSIILHSPILRFSGFSIFHYSHLLLNIKHWKRCTFTWNGGTKASVFHRALWKQYVSLLVPSADAVRTVRSVGWLLESFRIFFFFIHSILLSIRLFSTVKRKHIIKPERNPFQKWLWQRCRQGTYKRKACGMCVHLMCNANTTWIMRMWKCT